MAFAVADFHDLVQLLESHPEWRSDLRRLLLTDDIIELPKIVRDLAEAILHALQHDDLQGFHCMLISAEDITTSGMTSLELVRKVLPTVVWRG